MQKKNPTRYYCKEEIKTKQGYDKKTCPKLMLNKLKVMKNSTSIYTPWAPNSNFFWRNFQSTCGPCSPCAPTCTHVWTMSELRLNWKWTKTQLRVNLHLIKSEMRVN
jgi:hypothetical protein